MKRKLKGFTLIECLVALAILGIASLTMAQIYAQVSLRNKNNHLENTSLANQMAYVEQYTKSEAIELEFDEPASGTTLPHEVSGATAGGGSSKDRFVSIVSSFSGNEYSYGVDLYTLESRDGDNVKTDESMGHSYNLRYKYFMGHE
ncbi:MAG: prepilin-type N-terminal cleavage/methylation domain-containing protein [Oscillospiraceae bacterium]|nr:prepilin-type N-terminal cleavage/methylation domain-containing protein [Oscillospiraceae bacterium]